MKYTPVAFEVNLREGFCFAVDSLFAVLCTLQDQRDARGLRYALVTVLVFIILAKLAGEDHLRGIAQWVRLRQVELGVALALVKPQAPHATTYSRILKHAVDIGAFERVVSGFFAAQPGRQEVARHDSSWSVTRPSPIGCLSAAGRVGASTSASRAPRERDPRGHTDGTMPRPTKQDRHWGCVIGSAGAIGADRGAGRRVRVDGEGEPTAVAARHCDLVWLRVVHPRVQPLPKGLRHGHQL